MGRHYQHGTQLFELRRYREAIDEFTAELRENPESALAFAMRAASWLNSGKTRLAAKDVHEALRINPNLGYAHYILSCILTRKRKPEEAEAAAREAIRFEIRALYYFRLAEIYFLRGLHDDCLKSLVDAQALEPLHAPSILMRAKCLNALRRYEEAKSCLLTLLSHNPEHPAAHQELGRLSLEAGSAAEACESLREARRLNPIANNDKAALARAYGKMMWPFRLLDPHVIPLGSWLPAWRWLWLVVLTGIPLVASIALPERLSTRIAINLLSYNLLLLPFTLDFFAMAIGQIAFRKELDMRGAGWFDGLFRVVFPFACHGAATFLAVENAFEPVFCSVYFGVAPNLEIIKKLSKRGSLSAWQGVCFVFMFVPAVVAGELIATWELPAIAIACWCVSLVFSFLLAVF